MNAYHNRIFQGFFSVSHPYALDIVIWNEKQTVYRPQHVWSLNQKRVCYGRNETLFSSRNDDWRICRWHAGRWHYRLTDGSAIRKRHAGADSPEYQAERGGITRPLAKNTGKLLRHSEQYVTICGRDANHCEGSAASRP
jgi:hypothetical protein